MPDASHDPLEAAAAALQTTVGSDETALRAKLGNEGYERWKREHDELTRSQLDHHHATVSTSWGQASYVQAKARFWDMLSIAVIAGVGCGVIEFFRWVI